MTYYIQGNFITLKKPRVLDAKFFLNEYLIIIRVDCLFFIEYHSLTFLFFLVKKFFITFLEVCLVAWNKIVIIIGLGLYYIY